VTQKDIDGGCKGEGDTCPLLSYWSSFANGYSAGVLVLSLVYYKNVIVSSSQGFLTINTFI